MQGSTTCPRAAPPHTAPVDVGGLWKNIQPQNWERRLGSDESGVGAPASLPGGSGLVPTTTLSLSESLPLRVLLLVTTCSVAYMQLNPVAKHIVGAQKFGKTNCHIFRRAHTHA